MWRGRKKQQCRRTERRLPDMKGLLPCVVKETVLLVWCQALPPYNNRAKVVRNNNHNVADISANIWLHGTGRYVRTCFISATSTDPA